MRLLSAMRLLVVSSLGVQTLWDSGSSIKFEACFGIDGDFPW